MKWPCLAHLSQENNTQALALKTHRRILGDRLPLGWPPATSPPTCWKCERGKGLGIRDWGLGIGEEGGRRRAEGEGPIAGG